MSGVKFSQLPSGGNIVSGDAIVGLRSGVDLLLNYNSLILSNKINQVAHGLIVGNIIGLSGSSYVPSKANLAANANVVGIVVNVLDANDFVIQFGGYVSGLSGLTAGVVYFLSAVTAGLMTATPPATAGQILKPLFIADSSTSGYWLNYNGQQL